ncbi:hypothetical protein C2S51_001707 [Perilla frutescens var. frutescens]|nr:hypothetical protein C2S51_001707 [Perilla frutescens var. frutescens]
MMADSDYGLNLKLGFDGSLQKVLTRTMLDHEDIFKNQVLELHRLYKSQTILMKEDFKVGSGGFPHSIVGSFPANFKYESSSAEMRSNEVHAIQSLGSVKNRCLKEYGDTLKHRQLSLDLELACSHHTIDNKDLSSYCIAPGVSALIKHGIYDDNYSSNKALKLSLGADADAQSDRKACNNKIVSSPSLQAIHLEGSSNGKDLFTIPACTYATLATHSGAKNEFETSCSFRIRKSDDFNWISQSQSLTVGMENFLEQKHLYQGVEQCREDLSCKNMVARRKLFTSHEVGELDLNKALPDESSVNPIDPRIFNSSQYTFSGVSHNAISDHGQATSFTVLGRSNNNCSTQSSALTQHEITTSTVMTSPSKDVSEHISISKLCSVDFSSVGEFLSGNKDTVNGSKNFIPENAVCGISSPEKSCQRMSLSEMYVEKKKEKKLHTYNLIQELLEGADSNRSPTSCKSDYNTDDASSNRKTELGVIELLNVPPSMLKSPESSVVGKEHVEQNVKRILETKSQYSGPKKEELAAEVETTVRMGAVSLIYFSCLARNQDHNSPESKKRKKSCSAEREMPESSSESYESIMLKQADCSVDEYCVSSTPSEAMCLDKKGNGVKLKRGRRMKDFRKEILPSLASLSRHEISEDIKIMELALRSRDFKKYNSKNARRNGRMPSVRSRRPRLRRYCS